MKASHVVALIDSWPWRRPLPTVALSRPSRGTESSTGRPGSAHVWGQVSYKASRYGRRIHFHASRSSKQPWGAGAMNESGRYSVTAYQPGSTFRPGDTPVFIRPLKSRPGALECSPQASRTCETTSPPKDPSHRRSQATLPRFPIEFIDLRTSASGRQHHRRAATNRNSPEGLIGPSCHGTDRRALILARRDRPFTCKHPISQRVRGPSRRLRPVGLDNGSPFTSRSRVRGSSDWLGMRSLEHKKAARPIKRGAAWLISEQQT